MATINLAVVAGDGIGPEVVAEGLKALGAALDGESALATTEYDLGARRWHATGETLPDSVLGELRGHDAILLGAVGDPGVPSGVLERGLLLRLRFELDHYVNLRPARLYPGVVSPLAAPGEIDFVVVREGTEGPYVGNGGAVRVGTPQEIATEVSVDYCHVDAASMYFVQSPERFDVIVTDNLFGDILTDLGGAVAGGIGRAASANLNPARTGPSLFEPVHGSAPDIAGTGRADPRAAVISAAMMCDFLGEADASTRILNAVDKTDDVEGTTSQIGDAIAATC